MAYITASDYYDVYNGEEIPGEDFERIAARACEAVDAMTGWKLKRYGLDGLPDFVLAQVKLACCAQVESLYLNGIETALNGSDGGSGYSIGKASITKALGGAGSSGSGASALCMKAYQALIPTGLLFTGVPVLC